MMRLKFHHTDSNSDSPSTVEKVVEPTILVIPAVLKRVQYEVLYNGVNRYITFSISFFILQEKPASLDSMSYVVKMLYRLIAVYCDIDSLTRW